MAILEYDQQSPLHRSRSDVEVDSRACGHLVQGTVLKLGRSENFLLFQWCFRGARWFFHIENLKGRLGLLERTPSSLLHVYCCYCLSIVTVFPSFWCTLFGLSSLLSFSSAPHGEREKAEYVIVFPGKADQVNNLVKQNVVLNDMIEASFRTIIYLLFPFS